MADRSLDLRLPEAHASDSSGPRAGRHPSLVSVRIAAEADLIAVACFGVLAIFPGMKPESTPQSLGHLRILLWFRLSGKPQSVRTVAGSVQPGGRSGDDDNTERHMVLPAPSVGGSTSADVVDGSGGEADAIGAEECDQLGDLLGPTDPFHGYEAGEMR